MSFDRACESCGRSEWTDRVTGKKMPLEVCYSNKHGKWTCLRCHLAKVTGPEIGNVVRTRADSC